MSPPHTPLFCLSRVARLIWDTLRITKQAILVLVLGDLDVMKMVSEMVDRSCQVIACVLLFGGSKVCTLLQISIHFTSIDSVIPK